MEKQLYLIDIIEQYPIVYVNKNESLDKIVPKKSTIGKLIYNWIQQIMQKFYIKMVIFLFK